MPSDTIASETLELVRRLIAALHDRQVGYVHWKSNINIDDAMRGVDDLDLLVRRSDHGDCLEVLAELGFCEAEDPPRKRIPGIRHFFAYDEQAGCVVHVHLHVQLVVGHDLTKNYHLPLEAALIDSARHDREIPLPAAELELLVYILRMVLKFAISPNPLSQYDRLGVHREFEFLEDCSDESQLRRALEEHLPWLDRELFEAARRCLRPGTSNGFRLRVRGRLHAALSAYGRRGRLADAWLKFARRLGSAVGRRVRRRVRKKRLADGGALIAVVGGDGAGKTTLIEHISRHFSKVFDSQRVHLGKPIRSWSTRLFDVLLKADRLVARLLRIDASRRSVNRSQSMYLLHALRLIATARDRCRCYARARRAATAGQFVICDRWPLKCLTLMDGPRICDPTPTMFARRWIAALKKQEAAYYRKFAAPDVLLVLVVHPDVAVARKTTESELSVRPRSQEVWQTDWEAQGATVIDASAEADEVARRATALIWKAL